MILISLGKVDGAIDVRIGVRCGAAGAVVEIGFVDAVGAGDPQDRNNVESTSKYAIDIHLIPVLIYTSNVTARNAQTKRHQFRVSPHLPNISIIFFPDNTIKLF